MESGKVCQAASIPLLVHHVLRVEPDRTGGTFNCSELSAVVATGDYTRFSRIQRLLQIWPQKTATKSEEGVHFWTLARLRLTLLDALLALPLGAKTRVRGDYVDANEGTQAVFRDICCVSSGTVNA